MTLEFAEAFFDDARRHDRLFELVEHLHPGIASKLEGVRRLGHDWAKLSRPFALFDGERAVAHVGVVGIPLVVEGTEVTVGCLHAAVTHPEARRRGHFRALMERALAWCDASFPAIVAFTDLPGLLEPFGFRRQPEHTFHLPVEPPPRYQGFQKLDFDRSLHVATMRRILEERRPLSSTFAVADRGALVALNLPLHEGDLACLRHCRELDLLAVWGIEQSTLKLYDLIAREAPPLDEVVRQIGRSVQGVEIHFPPPDGWNRPFEPRPASLPGGALWVRGPVPGKNRPLLIPPLARCR